MGRVYTIDYLRGMLALLVMLYHYSIWEKLFTPDAASFLTRNALYGVSLFFIISGFSLTLSYYRRFDHFDIRALKDYFFKRFARIYPLYWLVVTLFLASLLVGGKTFPAIEQILLHPVIFLICNVLWFNGTDIVPEAQIVFMILVTLIASHIVYARYELPMTRYLLSRRPRHD